MNATAERFWVKVEKTDSCWTWRASLNGNGYGQFKADGTMKLAHRVAYELLVGAIPRGLHLDHLCRNRICVNPDHLEPVSHAENRRRGMYFDFPPEAMRATGPEDRVRLLIPD